MSVRGGRVDQWLEEVIAGGTRDDLVAAIRTLRSVEIAVSDSRDKAYKLYEAAKSELNKEQLEELRVVWNNLHSIPNKNVS